ncbi:Alcohol acetyltransferase [Macrophomina phaseolina MS6]|uniref:Alcohol acetyltransferase n=1 Tax=Macrophomina phaseolina (strain MS6) TaxID=1126212 RepID=K2RBI9_MACPH|nr:Alcohol acetyltransferase [Macrophomina phaseolina MS6]
MLDNGLPHEVLRPAGTSERRCIMRHVLGYYRALILTGRYSMPNGFELKKESFYPSLKHCISSHPMLSTAIKDEQTEAPEFIRPSIIDLSNHVEIQSPIEVASTGISAELEALRHRLCKAHDQPFSNIERIPPWKIIVVPINNPAATTGNTCWILFSYSHSHGDGSSALFFHRTLLHALRAPSLTTPSPSTAATNSLFTPPATALLPPVELAKPLPITWPFLLLPLISHYLPTPISSFLPTLFRVSVTPHTPDMWKATPTSYDVTSFRTAIAFAVAPASTLQRLLQQCRAHPGVKLTAVLHALVVRALSASLPADAPAGTFVAQTAIDLRPLMPEAWQGAFALGVSVAYHAFPRCEDGHGFDQSFWQRARDTTAHLAERSGTLVDQPIGLLSYLRSFRGWLEGLVGKERDSSYEVSNLLAFDPDEEEGGSGADGVGGWGFRGMVFTQPANAVGSAVNFNVVSTKGGDLVVSLTWQRGVLGVEGDEDEWARGVCEHLEGDMKALAPGE